VFPSLYEGFGPPVLESMLLGTPVISSNTASIPEVAGDAALLVDPYDTRELAEAIRSIDADEGLRDSLSQRGLKQSARFSPEEYRKRLAAVYRRFLGSEAVSSVPALDASSLPWDQPATDLQRQRS